MASNDYRTTHGAFRPGDVIWHVGPCGERTRAATVRDCGPSFVVRFHDDPRGVHLVPAVEVRHPGSWVRPAPVQTLGDILREAIGRRRQDHIVALIAPHVGPLPSSFPKVHRNRERAEREAARLAVAHPGNVFRVFAAVSEVEATAVPATRRLAD